MKKAIVIGAGAAGLATAALLGREGYNVTVVEKNESIGGRSGELTVDGFRFDTGPSWYLMPDAFEHFFNLLGTTTDAELDMVDLDPAYRLFPEGNAAIDVNSGREEAIALFESIEKGAGQKLSNYLDSASETYQIAVDRFLYTTFSAIGPMLHKDVRNRLIKLAALLTQPLSKYVAKRFQDHRLRQILTYPAVFLSSHPDRTPALYHLMSHTDLVQGVRYPQGGFTAVMEAFESLARVNGARIFLHAEVTAITYSGGQTTGVRIRKPDGSASHLDADLVVSAADLHFTETRLLSPDMRSYDEKYFAGREPGLSTVLVMLGVKGKLPQLTHHNLLFSKDWDKDFTVVFDGPVTERPLQSSQSIYISMPSATDPSTAPEGDENLFILVPTPAIEELGRGDAYSAEASPAVETIAEAAIDQIASWCDIPDLRERIVVKRTLGPQDFAERYYAWRGGSIGPSHTLRQSAFFRGSNKSRKLDGLYYAGATTVPGVGVPMCLISAENVIKRVRGDRSPHQLES
ncbi:phytoene desaturase family protein [Corynebacterium breve]|uniref:Phytoene desaturase family protein n=1 Tax=Corynebacterium breve TaxID=3049799 RepID=A0ABY8VHT6_9CORY|nr:phytoene desaturase family protein [Corynebacterium breve]WIM67818.1 phytoene desaturase family protein [Corynebacterium breve]